MDLRCGRLLAAALFGLCLVGSAQSQATTEGRIYLSFAPDHLVSTQEIEAGKVFSYYLVAEIPSSSAGLAGFEVTVQLSDQILFTGFDYSSLAPGPINVGVGWTGAGFFHFVVGLGGCIDAEAFPLALVEFQGLVLEDVDDLYASVHPLLEGHSSNDGRAPAWGSCDDRLLDFEIPEAGATIQPVVGNVATESKSFGALRALYSAGGLR